MWTPSNDRAAPYRHEVTSATPKLYLQRDRQRDRLNWAGFIRACAQIRPSRSSALFYRTRGRAPAQDANFPAPVVIAFAGYNVRLLCCAPSMIEGQQPRAQRGASVAIDRPTPMSGAGARLPPVVDAVGPIT